MTNAREVEIAKETLAILEAAAAAVIDDIRRQNQCLNVDFHTVTFLAGAIAHQRQRLSFHKFEGYFGRTRSNA